MPLNEEPHTAADVATWMVEELRKQGRLSQSHAAAEIKHRFGDQFVSVNDNGNLAIIKEVTAQFNEQTRESVVWVRRQFMWRTRQPGDKPGRQQ